MSSQDEFDWEWWVVSYHEAGHAVANIALGLPVREVNMTVTVGVFGGVSSSGGTVGWMPPVDDTEAINRRMVSDMCGAVAEARFYMGQGIRARKAYRLAHSNATGDYSHAESLLEHATIDLEDAENAAAELVDDYWDAIETVADELRKGDGYLSGADVESLMLRVAA